MASYVPARQRARQRDRGAVTAEYAVVTSGVVAFGAMLIGLFLHPQPINAVRIIVVHIIQLVMPFFS